MLYFVILLTVCCMDNLHSHIKNKNDLNFMIDKLEKKLIFFEQKVYKTLLPECELKQYSNIELRNLLKYKR